METEKGYCLCGCGKRTTRLERDNETRRSWNCKGCKKQFTVKTGTIFEDSPLSLSKGWYSGPNLATLGLLETGTLEKMAGMGVHVPECREIVRGRHRKGMDK